MTYTTRSTLYFWAILAVTASTIFGVLAIIHSTIARADPIAGSWHDAEPAALAGGTATWLLGALVALRALEMGLKWLAPRTETRLDDRAYATLHLVRETAEEILTHVKPVEPPGPVPAVRDPQ